MTKPKQHVTKILIADDEERVCAPLLKELRKAFQRPDKVIAVDTVEEATSEVQGYDVAVIDKRFTNFSPRTSKTEDGVEVNFENAGILILEAAMKDPFTEAIIMTGFGDEVWAGEVLDRGAIGYVVKGPSNAQSAGFVQELISKIQKALRRQQIARNLYNLIQKCEETVNTLKDEVTPTSPGLASAKDSLAEARKLYNEFLEFRSRKAASWH